MILRDGIRTTILIPTIAAALYHEAELTPPGVSGRGGIDMTGNRTVGWQPMLPKQVKALTPLNVKVMVDADLIPSVWASVQVNQLFTVVFPNAARLLFWGWLEELNFDPFSEGNRPGATMVLQPSNLNYKCVYVGPEWVSGTSLCV